MVKMKHLTMTKGGITGSCSDYPVCAVKRTMDDINQLTCRLWSGVRLFLIGPDLFMKGRYGCKGENLNTGFI